MKTTKSLKGNWGHVGAPPKAIKLPTVVFTVERAIKLNPNVCELTVRKFVTKCLEAGVLKKGDPIPQPKGGVGRPKFRFEPTGKELPAKLVKTPKVTANKPVTADKTVTVKPTKAKTAKATPASAPIVSVVTPAPAPVETTPVAATAPVDTAPVTATPAAVVEPAPLP